LGVRSGDRWFGSHYLRLADPSGVPCPLRVGGSPPCPAAQMMAHCCDVVLRTEPLRKCRFGNELRDDHPMESAWLVGQSPLIAHLSVLPAAVQRLIVVDARRISCLLRHLAKNRPIGGNGCLDERLPQFEERPSKPTRLPHSSARRLLHGHCCRPSRTRHLHWAFGLCTPHEMPLACPSELLHSNRHAPMGRDDSTGGNQQASEESRRADI
jgi:hypothetical protein